MNGALFEALREWEDEVNTLAAQFLRDGVASSTPDALDKARTEVKRRRWEASAPTRPPEALPFWRQLLLFLLGAPRH